MAMLELKNLTKSFGETTAVHNVTISIEAGEIYGLLGPNGAGKTTTVKMAVGILHPTSGSITIDGIDLQQNPDAAKSRTGYIPDDPYVYERMSGREYLHFVGEIFGFPRKERNGRIEMLKKIFPIADILDEYMEQYSRGNKQKIVLLAAFLHSPQILLVDEPMVGLDPESVAIVKTLFKNFAKEDRGAVLISTHTLALVDELFDRIGVLKGGKLIAEGSPQELRAKAGAEAKTLEELYFALTK